MSKDIELISKLVQVVNKHTHKETSDDVYIGRGSVFKSPYSHLPSKYKDIITCKSRKEAVDLYRKHFENILNSCGCKYKTFKIKLRQLVIKLKLGEKVNLVCSCAPDLCHGNVIKEYLLKEINK